MRFSLVMLASVSLGLTAHGADPLMPDLPKTPLTELQSPAPTATAPKPPPTPKEESVPVPVAPPDEWTDIGQYRSPKIFTPRVASAPDQPPPFDLFATSRVVNLTPDWWNLGALVVRVAPLGDQAVHGAQISWQRGPFGGIGALLRAELPVFRIAPSSAGLTYLEIVQAVALNGEGRDWNLESSPFRVELVSRGERTVLVETKAGQGLWRARLGTDGLSVSGWTAAALNACRLELSKYLSDEELRLLLAKSGEVVWVLKPNQNLTNQNNQGESKP